MGPVVTAAFRRLCVETYIIPIAFVVLGTAAFRRLCVETYCTTSLSSTVVQPPSGGCVLKRQGETMEYYKLFSRLQAAVC